MVLAFKHPTAGQLLLGTTALASRFRASDGGNPPPPPPPAQNWYDEVFAKRDGTGVGPRVSSWTDAATWAAATAGVSNNGTTITVSGSDITATAIDFSGFKLINNGSNNVFEDCLGDINPNGQGGTKYQWDMGGLNPTVRYCRITNPSKLSGAIMLAFHDATGTAREEYNHFVDVCAPDPVKGPDAGTMFHSYGSFMDSIFLVQGAHVDTYDLRLSEPGSSVKRGLIVGDATPGSASATLTGTGFVNGVRQAPGDFGGNGGDGLIVEECIIIGHDDPGASSTLLDVGNAGSTGNVMYNVLVDIREHNSVIDNGNRMDDWLVYRIDWAQCLADGFVTVGAFIPFPNLGSQPAAVPSTMSAPVITAVPGGFSYAAMTRAANQRSLITGYTLEWSTDGVSWTPVSASLEGGVVATGAASNVRARVFATNGVGDGVVSSVSNIISSIPAATLSVAEPAVSGHPYDVGAVIGRNAALWPVDVTTTGVADGTEVYAKRAGTADTPALVGTVASGAVSGTLSAPLSATNYQLEVTCGALTDTTTGTFGTGHGMVMHSQSEPHRCFDSFFNDAPNDPAEIDWDNLVFLSVNHLGSGAVTRIDRNSGSNFTTSMKYLSNVLAQVAPGEKFVIRDAMEPGTALTELLADSDLDRDWDPHYKGILDYDRVTLKDQPTWLVFCWWAQERANYRNELLDSFSGPFFGEYEDGSPYTLGTTYTAIRYSKTLDHIMTDASAASDQRGRGAYSADEAKWTWFMNGFTHTSNLTTFESDGSVVAGMRNIRETMEGLRTFAADARTQAIATADPIGYGAQVCRNNGSHPSETQRYGLPLMGEIIALNWLKAIGKVTAPVPRITGVTWATTHADVSVNVGVGNQLTTYRDELALGAVDPETHRMAVAGFAFTRGGGWNWPTSVAIVDNGAATGTATIRVSASFQNGDVLIYAGGGGTGQILTDDEVDDYNLNIPVVKIAGVSNPMPPVEQAAEGAYLTASGI